jgi:uncharacterized protein (UPF0332 family)
LDKARECLVDAEAELARKAYAASINRSYYCIFNAMRAVLALDRFDSRKHSGVASEFRKKYVLPGIFPVEYSDIVTAAFMLRSKSDYDDFYVVSKDDVASQAANAKRFLSAIEDFLQKHAV